ncbi:Zinc finger transcription factor [Parasponia andersonii]|uniref:Zinc finger transcription factor n=1 Tax=Parasponia andersonii TaxID=3476 RepID=A0A2P5CJD6_PARAD|nr:Zinc finger transcription factor [Parasponia andersonii]
MALIVDQQPTNLKHFCRICKKGFVCGRALGGHMRAHGIGDESGHLEDDDAASDWDEKLASGNVPPSNKRMYALRTNPNRLRSCRACENCGKEFLSWKSFLEHGKCSSEDAESLVSSPESDGDDATGRRGCGWSKRKRSFRAKVGNLLNPSSHCPSSEEEDLANCLMMLSNAAVDPLVADEPEESCASASKEEEQIRRNSINFNNIAPISYRVPVDNNHNNIKVKGVAKATLFECKACKKVFNSHQALGGHRASHKKVKGCFAARLDHVQFDDSLATAEDDDATTQEEFFPAKSNSTLKLDHHGSNSSPLASTSKRKSKVHECSICHRIFSSGQALGGHKRCHWITPNAAAADTSAALVKFQEGMELQIHHHHHRQTSTQHQPRRPMFDNSDHDHDHDHPDDQTLDLKLDLNLPAPAGDIARARRDHGNVSVVVPSFEVSTEIFLQPWMGPAKDTDQDHKHHQNEVDNYLINKEEYNNNNNDNDNTTTNSNGTYSMQKNMVEDEADSKVKLAKLSELKDMNVSEGSSPWLQVGIGSTTDVGAGP